MSEKTQVRFSIDSDLWRKVRVYALEKGLRVNEALEEILREYFGVKSDD